VGETCDHLDTEVKCNTVLSYESIDLVVPEEVTEDICITALLCVLISTIQRKHSNWTMITEFNNITSTTTSPNSNAPIL
jgi:hypothetical protein